MPRKCTVCGHLEKEQMDKLIVEGRPYRYIALQYNVSEMALSRHKAHLNGTLLKAKEVEEIAHADSLLDQVKDLQTKALSILSKCEKSQDWKTALSAIREARGCLELLGKLAGQLKEGNTVNVIVSPQWIGLRTLILTALEPYSEARDSVSKALEKVINGSDN